MFLQHFHRPVEDRCCFVFTQFPCVLFSCTCITFSSTTATADCKLYRPLPLSSCLFYFLFFYFIFYLFTYFFFEWCSCWGSHLFLFSFFIVGSLWVDCVCWVAYFKQIQYNTIQYNNKKKDFWTMFLLGQSFPQFSWVAGDERELWK